MAENSFQKSITIVDIAEALGVSKSTVSRAISGKGRIGEATRARVLDYIEKHDYKPNVIAQSLAQSKTFNVCAVMPSEYGMADLPFFRNSLLGLVEELSDRGYDVIVSMSKERDIANLERVISNHKVDGVVLLRTVADDPAVEYLRDKGVPFVVLGSVPQKDVLQVDSNHRDACEELTGHLLEQGIKRMALIGGNERHIVTRNRLKGFRDAYESKGLTADEDLIYQNVESRDMTEQVVAEILNKDIDCIMCMDDTICDYVLHKCARDGIKIPTDVKVASFYSSKLLENHIPSITSLKFDAKELGTVCGKVLLEKLDNGNPEMHTTLGYEVTLKKSTQA